VPPKKQTVLDSDSDEKPVVAKKPTAVAPASKPAPAKKAALLDSDDDEDDFKPPAKTVVAKPPA